jgi:uncharacterized RDD family membrane protein YckC
MASRSQPLDSIIQVVTPENIAFEYRIAGPFRRLPALLIDYAFVAFIETVLMIGLVMAFGWLSIGLAIGVYSVSAFLIEWFYGGFFETFFNGQTPGKMICSLRVLNDRGQPINGLQAVLRNILRTADIVLGVGMVVMAMNRRYQRLGDLVCGTIVVVEDRQWLTGVAKLDDPRAIQLAAYLPPNFVVSKPLARALATYVERRRFFSAPRRREVAKHLAEPLLERFGLPADTSYDLLLRFVLPNLYRRPQPGRAPAGRGPGGDGPAEPVRGVYEPVAAVRSAAAGVCPAAAAAGADGWGGGFWTREIV